MRQRGSEDSKKGPWKDPPWLPRVLRRTCPPHRPLRDVCPSRRFANPSRSLTSLHSRRRASTGFSATSAGSPAWLPRSPRGAPMSPIEDFSGSMSLSFRDHRFEETRKTIESCKERDQTYDAPLFVTAEFMNTNTGEIKSQTVFMGDFPLMTERGTFIINGTERVVVSQLVRSPGVYFERTPDKTSDKDIYTAKIIPSRGAWLEFEID